MSQQKLTKTFTANFLTMLSAFLMGFIDAYTYLEQNGSFASAQTGNLVTLSVKLFTGEFREALSHTVVFFGFALGAFTGEALIEKIKKKQLQTKTIILLVQAILLGILAAFQTNLADSIMIFSLGLLAGYELTVFRKFRQTTVNNGIMTGNTKNMMNHLYHVFFNKNKEARRDFINLFTIIVVFLLGAGAGAVIIKWHVIFNLWIAFFLVILSLILTVKVGSQEES